MMNRLRRIETPIEGVEVIERVAQGDARGWFERFFCASELGDLLGDRSIVQVNRSFTAQAGTVRGVHLQRAPHVECKMVSCSSGSIFDVAVDLRKGSPTFLNWFGVELSAENRRSLWIPEGCGHAFQSMVPDVSMVYLHTESYVPSAEMGVNVLDPRIGIDWPMEVEGRSERDASFPLMKDDFRGIVS